MIVKLLTEHHLEFLSLKGGCRGSAESTLVKMSNCWKSHAAAQLSSCCNVAVSVLCLFFSVPWMGLQRVISYSLTFISVPAKTFVVYALPYFRHYSKTCLKRPLKRTPKTGFYTDYRFMQVKSIAECSKGSILQYFRPSLSYNFPLRPLLCLFLSGRLRQVLLYMKRWLSDTRRERYSAFSGHNSLASGLSPVQTQNHTIMCLLHQLVHCAISDINS